MNYPIVIDNCNGPISNWTLLNAATENLALGTVRIFGTGCIQFDKKADGAITSAGAYRALDSVNLDFAHNLAPGDKIIAGIYVSDLTSVAYSFIRLGATAANYIEWRIDDGAMVAGWSLCQASIYPAYLGGTGWDPADVDYLAVGVEFDAAGNTLTNIRVDKIMIYPSIYGITS